MNRFRSCLSHFKFYILLHKIKTFFIEKKRKKIIVRPIVKRLKANKNAVLLMLTPIHANLGDHAITLAECELFKKTGIEYTEITEHDLYILSQNGYLDIFNKRTILFNGGGYLGTLWLYYEHLARKIVASNPDSRIIFMPNTIFYSNSAKDQDELKKSIEIYNNHHNIVFFARENTSYEYMKKIYKNVKLCPDMVLSMNEQYKSTKRNGCLICLRDDIEKTLTDENSKIIIEQLTALFAGNCKKIDMRLSSTFDISNRIDVLKTKFEEFRNTQLVITDRLHGMIFSVITGTPCIVVDSKSPKIKGCYEWIKDLNYIEFCNDYSKINNLARKLINNDNSYYDNSRFSEYYSALTETIKNKNIRE